MSGNGEKLTGWRALGKLVGHSLTGLAVFAIVAIPAIALHFLTHWLESQGLQGTFTIAVLKLLEYVILVGDAALFLWLMVKAWYKAGEEIEL